MVSTRNRNGRNKKDYKSNMFRLSFGKAFLQPRYQIGFPSCPVCPKNVLTTNIRSITVVFLSFRASYSSFLLPIKCFNKVLWMLKSKGKFISWWWRWYLIAQWRGLWLKQAHKASFYAHVIFREMKFLTAIINYWRNKKKDISKARFFFEYKF